MAAVIETASTPCTPTTGRRFADGESSGLLTSALLRERARAAHSQGEAKRLAEVVASLEAEKSQLEAQVLLVQAPQAHPSLFRVKIFRRHETSFAGAVDAALACSHWDPSQKVSCRLGQPRASDCNWRS